MVWDGVEWNRTGLNSRLVSEGIDAEVFSVELYSIGQSTLLQVGSKKKGNNMCQNLVLNIVVDLHELKKL